MRRVLLVADVSAEALLGGAERMLIRHMHALHAAGMAVTVLSRQPTPDAPLSVTLMDGVEEHRLVYGGDRGWRGLMQLKAGARRWWRQHQGAFDVVVAEQPFVMWALERAGCRLPRLQVCHAFAFEEYMTRYGLDWGWGHAAAAATMRRIEARLYRGATRLLVLSAHMRQRLGEAFGIHEDVSVAAGGNDAVDEALFAARGRLRAELGWQGPVVVSLRNLVPRTGIDLLVQAAAMLRYDRPDLRWVVMGTGALLAPLRRLAAELGVASHIEFTGYLAEAEVKRRLVAADLFMLPTRALEGFGLVTVEAGACGLPVVATPVGANVEVVRALPHGRLAADATPEALARAVEDLLHAFDGADVEAQRGALRAASSRFDWAHHDAGFLQALQGIGG
jgi:glycosyltransferase involved in cell wall biosynthesis